MGTKTLNGAGASAADPILQGLPFAIIGACSSIDAAQVNAFALDPATGAVTNDLKANATPAVSVVDSGTNGSYINGTSTYTIGSTAGLAPGDYIWLGHASITDGIYEIATVPSGTTLTLVDNPMVADQSAISYQVAWKLEQATVLANANSSAGGTNNFPKLLAEDAGAVESTQEDNFFVRDAPAGSAVIALDGVNYTGQTVTDFALTLAILSGWANQGGVSHVSLANHSTQSGGTVNNFTWTSGGGTAEKTLADAESSGLTIEAGDGDKYGAIQLMSKSGGETLDFDISITVDSTGPTLTITLAGA